MSANIKNIDEFKCPAEYELVKSEYVNEVNSLGIILKHKKSGARIMLLSNSDDNKVFSIGFRTPPKNDTGTQHIIEHTVLCGSKNFPAKDPFVELVKGSLNTYLNATTYPDKTLYPVASTNAKDFKNLMNVYLDAVFAPNIYKVEEIFKQEGWHYELDSPDGELIYNGVVYNEMKGAYSSEDNMLETYLIKALYPDTTYAYDSGGDPDVIPALKREDYLEYHRNYYHPVNSYIYLYGDMDLEENLEFIDKNYLANFDEIELDSEIASQEKFAETKKIKQVYAVSEDDDREDNTHYAYAVMTDVTLDRKICSALDILSYILIDMPGAFLKEKLVEKGLGTDINTDVCDLIKQSYFSIYIKNAGAGKSDEILSTIRECLSEICEKGIDKKVLTAVLNSNEFKDREGEFGSYPKGLFYYLRAMHTWLYDDDKCFDGIKYEDNYKFIRENIDNGFFEDLIKKYFLDNTHQVIVEMNPEKGLTAKKDAKTVEELKAYKESLSEAEIEKIIEDTKKLKKYQSEPTPLEDLEKIPLLKLSDIERKAKNFNLTESENDGIKTLFAKEETNGIVYLNMFFDVNDMQENMAFLSTYSSYLGYMDTQKRSYLDFDTEVNLCMGGLNASIVNYKIYDGDGRYDSRFEISAKMLKSNVGRAMELINEMIFETSFEDEKRVCDVLKEFRSRHKNGILYSGHQVAALRAQAHSSQFSWANDQNSGLGYYEYVSGLDDNFDSRKSEFIGDMKHISNKIFTKKRAVISVISDEEGLKNVQENLSKIQFKADEETYDFSKSNKVNFVANYDNEAFTTPAKIQYVALCGTGAEKTDVEKSGALNVIRQRLNYDYLWNNVRVLGGAYGVGCRFFRDGNVFFTSYRDPKLAETIETYKKAVDYLKNFDISDRELTKTIIGTVSGLDTPLTPLMKGMRSIGAYFSKTPFEAIQDERNQVLDCSVADFRKAGEMLEKSLAVSSVCVIGSEEEIEKNRAMFKKVNSLM